MSKIVRDLEFQAASDTMNMLGVPFDGESEEKLMFHEWGYSSANYLPVTHFEPKSVEVHPRAQGRVALRALDDSIKNYQDLHLRTVLKARHGENSERITSTILSELATQATSNNASILTSKLHIGSGPDEDHETTLALWDNGNSYLGSEALEAAYLLDGARDLRSGKRVRVPARSVETSRLPTYAVLDTALTLNGRLTVASGNTAVDIVASEDESRDIDITTREIPYVIGNIAIARLPHIPLPQAARK